MFDKVIENIRSTFDERTATFHDAAVASIALLCNLLKQQEKMLEETILQKEAESELIRKKGAELAEIEVALDSLTRIALS
jgi:hypothetical protein